MIVDTQEEGHRVELPLPQEFPGALGKESAIDGVGSCSVLQEKARQGSSQSGPCLKRWHPRVHLAAFLGG